VADAYGHATEHAKRQKHNQAYPNRAPVKFLTFRDRPLWCLHEPLSASNSKAEAKKQQREKSNGSLQNKYDWIVELHTVRISVPEDKAGAAGSESYQPNAAEV
jgi:hypothetical protein